MRNLLLIGGFVIFGIIMFSCSVYAVDETEQAIVTRFGEVQGDVKTVPGLYFKAPFNIDQVTTYDKRLLRVDAPPQAMPDRNLLLLDIDVYARYRITDAIQFRKTLNSEDSARQVLGQIVNDALRAEVAQLRRSEIIGADVQVDEEGFAVTDADGNSLVTASESRSEMLARVLEAVVQDLADEPEPYGVEIVDVRVKRADFPVEVSDRVFARMTSEREKIARRLRAEGEEQSRNIRADANRQAEVIRADADKRSNQLRGEGEASAIAILAEALERDPEFFAFRRSLEAYRSIFDPGTTVILSADSPLFQFLDTSGGELSGQAAGTDTLEHQGMTEDTEAMEAASGGEAMTDEGEGQ